MITDLIARLEMLAMLMHDPRPKATVTEAITALREYKDANMKAAILHGEDAERIAELEDELTRWREVDKLQAGLCDE